MNKERILKLIIEQLSRDVDVLFTAAKTAHEAATHEENAPDNKYDTLSLEASYVAQGQANRAQELKVALEAYKNLPLRHFEGDSPIRLGALVTIAAEAATRTVFVGPLEGGLKVQQGDIEVVVITPASPLGKGLIGKVVGDYVAVGVGDAVSEFEIVEVC
ncbi:MAG: transcription elongation factor GreAB [Desulfuromonadaceae bacterium GWB2_53_15]|nr:MAG: transcription elongation factor GreAB [Desulfuromonadales bacterium GWD2_54_10]OHB32074.1 MAG: transcription elongation factor GreAB [Desulfuromonadaceae bacterium GWB2_53_15]